MRVCAPMCVCSVAGVQPQIWDDLSLITARPFSGQVSQDGKSLLDKLQRPLTPGSSDSLTASANYSKAVHHVLDVIHEVLHHQRQLENIWQHRKVRLHQRLQLCVFQQDVQQVGSRQRSSSGGRSGVRVRGSACHTQLRCAGGESGRRRWERENTHGLFGHRAWRQGSENPPQAALGHALARARGTREMILGLNWRL